MWTAAALLPLLLLATPPSTAQAVLPQTACGVMPARYGALGTVCCPEGMDRYGDGSACRRGAGPGSDWCALWANAALPRCATVTTTTPSPTRSPTVSRSVSPAYANLGKGSCRDGGGGDGIFTRYQLDHENGGSVHECQVMCDSQISCIAFEYSKVNAICEIHRTPVATVSRNAASQCFSLNIGGSCNVHRDCAGDKLFCNSSSVCMLCAHCNLTNSFNGNCPKKCNHGYVFDGDGVLRSRCSRHGACSLGSFCTGEHCLPCDRCTNASLSYNGLCPDRCRDIDDDDDVGTVTTTDVPPSGPHGGCSDAMLADGSPWRDAAGAACALYDRFRLCDRISEAEVMAQANTVSYGGPPVSALDVCCSCGGGRRGCGDDIDPPICVENRDRCHLSLNGAPGLRVNMTCPGTCGTCTTEVPTTITQSSVSPSPAAAPSPSPARSPTHSPRMLAPPVTVTATPPSGAPVMTHHSTPQNAVPLCHDAADCSEYHNECTVDAVSLRCPVMCNRTCGDDEGNRVSVDSGSGDDAVGFGSGSGLGSSSSIYERDMGEFSDRLGSGSGSSSGSSSSDGQDDGGLYRVGGGGGVSDNELLCNVVPCAKFCASPCGWSSLTGMCHAGAVTEADELDQGDCDAMVVLSGEPATVSVTNSAGNTVQVPAVTSMPETTAAGCCVVDGNEYCTGEIWGADCAHRCFCSSGNLICLDMCGIDVDAMTGAPTPAPTTDLTLEPTKAPITSKPSPVPTTAEPTTPPTLDPCCTHGEARICPGESSVTMNPCETCFCYMGGTMCVPSC